MIKQAGIVECEKCGATEELIAKIGCYNEIEYWLPNGWGMDYDKHMMLCPECLKRKSEGGIAMKKQTWIVECDLCGKVERAREVEGRYNETVYDLPKGWGHGHNKNFTLCPECLACISAREGDNVVESNGKE